MVLLLFILDDNSKLITFAVNATCDGYIANGKKKAKQNKKKSIFCVNTIGIVGVQTHGRAGERTNKWTKKLSRTEP